MSATDLKAVSILIVEDESLLRRQLAASLDPFALKQNIETKLKTFFTALSNLNREATKLG